MRDSLLDVVSRAHQAPTCIVLPTLDLALVTWRRIISAYQDLHRGNGVSPTYAKTAILCRTHFGMLRLWCPYALSPTMPMDTERYRRGFKLVSPWFFDWELRRWL